MIWYILGVGFALAVYPLDIAVVSILMYVPSIHSLILLDPEFTSPTFNVLCHLIGIHCLAYLGLIQQPQLLAAFMGLQRLPSLPRRLFSASHSRHVSQAQDSLRPLSPVHIYPFHALIGTDYLVYAGTLIAVSFYRWLGPLRPQDLSWTFKDGVRALQPGSIMNKMVKDTLGKWGWQGVRTGGWVGLSIIGVVAGLVAGVAEALGAFLLPHAWCPC